MAAAVTGAAATCAYYPKPPFWQLELTDCFIERGIGDVPPVRWKRRIRVQRPGLSLAADVNLAADINRQRAGARTAETSRQPKGDEMTEESGFKPLSKDELTQLAGEELPERAAMSLVNANVAIPINAAIAANVLSDNATAVAQAVQSGQIGQTN